MELNSVGGFLDCIRASLSSISRRMTRVPNTVVDTARDAQNALALVRTSPYQVIFIDVPMPSVDGLTFLRQLGSYARDTRVIVMTTNTGSVS